MVASTSENPSCQRSNAAVGEEMKKSQMVRHAFLLLLRAWNNGYLGADDSYAETTYVVVVSQNGQYLEPAEKNIEESKLPPGANGSTDGNLNDVGEVIIRADPWVDARARSASSIA